MHPEAIVPWASDWVSAAAALRTDNFFKTCTGHSKDSSAKADLWFIVLSPLLFLTLPTAFPLDPAVYCADV